MAQYPNNEFQGIYEGILNSMGSDDDLRKNLEAALRPMYEQSRAQLEEQRRANNAAIDVDAASRGMGNSTWVTDAKLQQLRGLNSGLASLDANYNNQLYSALLNAIQDRDNTAYSQAMQWWQYDQSKKGGSGSGGPTITPDIDYDTYLKTLYGADMATEKIKSILSAFNPFSKRTGNDTAQSANLWGKIKAAIPQEPSIKVGGGGGGNENKLNYER